MATLSFKGKSFVQNYHLGVKYHELIPRKTKSLTDKVSLKDNLIIHGDNLKALKALLPTYAGRVKCIYIDPPYNTGTEGWKYNDNVNSPMVQEWLGKVVDKEDLTRHDKWLCMMMPRLRLLRDLLRQDGVIYVNIDDNEIHHLKMILNEVFGEEHNLATFIWKKKSTSTNVRGTQISSQTDYVLAYGRSDSAMIKQRIRSKETRSYPFKDKEGDYRLDIIEKKHAGSYARESMRFPILGVEPREGKRWQIGEDTARDLERRNRLTIHNGIVKRKIYDYEDVDTFSAQPNILDSHGTTDSAARMLTEIFGQAEVFDNPKPVELIRHLCSLVCDKADLILDSFAGSGTTAHAVLDLNREDDGKRKFILVECEDYADKIAAERVRRVIKGVPDAKDDDLRNGLGGSFSFFELGEPIELESILEGSRLPSYLDLARYVFYTATGEEFIPAQVDEDKHLIGDSKQYEVYLFYKPDLDYLKSTALTLDVAKALGDYTDKKKLVFAPTKYLDLNDSELLTKHGLKDIEYCQLPFEIYRLKE